VSGEWSKVLALHYSHTVATCLHALQALTVLHDRMSYRPMMTLMSGVLETCMRVLGTCVPSYTNKSARLFFMLEIRGSQGVAGHVAASDPPQPGGEVQRHRTRGSAGAHLSREVRSGAIGHVAALEPTSAGRQGLEP
jgi:uncharacterized protein YqgV (UPF0045/DUF77 family)